MGRHWLCTDCAGSRMVLAQPDSPMQHESFLLAEQTSILFRSIDCGFFSCDTLTLPQLQAVASWEENFRL